MRRRSLPALALLGLLLAACGHSSPPQAGPTRPPHTSSQDGLGCCPAPDDTLMTGALVGIGGPSGAGVQHWAGTIHLAGQEFSTVATDGHGRFSLHLPAGRYELSATSPSYDDGRGACHALRAMVLAPHRTTHVRVICQLR